VQAEWLPEQYRSGAAFRAATRYKGAPLKLQQQLAQGPGVGGMYLPRRIGVGSTTCIMQWEVRFQALIWVHHMIASQDLITALRPPALWE